MPKTLGRNPRSRTPGWELEGWTLGWDPWVGTWGGTLVWDPGIKPYSRTLGRDPRVGPWSGTPEWDSHVCFYKITVFFVWITRSLNLLIIFVSINVFPISAKIRLLISCLIQFTTLKYFGVKFKCHMWIKRITDSKEHEWFIQEHWITDKGFSLRYYCHYSS